MKSVSVNILQAPTYVSLLCCHYSVWDMRQKGQYNHSQVSYLSPVSLSSFVIVKCDLSSTSSGKSTTQLNPEINTSYKAQCIKRNSQEVQSSPKRFLINILNCLSGTRTTNCNAFCRLFQNHN